MDPGIVFDVKKYALHDGPGIRTTVFLKGCPLACAWCHNPEGQRPEPQEFKPLREARGRRDIIGRHVGVDEIVREIEKDILFYDQSGGGATFSGGEPLAQPEFLCALLERCRERDIHTAIDTCGHARPEIFARAMELADLVLFDLKIMADGDHRKHTGVSNRRILDNLRLAAESKTPLRIRVPVVPRITDTRENLAAMGDYLNALPRALPVDLLPYHRIAQNKYTRLGMADPMAGVRPPEDHQMERIRNRFQVAGFDVHIGGAP